MNKSVLLVAMLAFGGCVSKAKYNSLQAEYDQVLSERNKLERKVDKRTESLLSVFEEMKKVRDKGLAKLNIEDGRAVLQLDSDVLFSSGSATLTAEGRKAVREIASILARDNSARFQVEGHTDSDAVSGGAFASNWHLGASRAINVVQEMVSAGMPAKRISAASMGQFQPVASNNSGSGKAQNRRIELVLQPELSEVLPYKRIARELNKRDGAGKGKKGKGKNR